MKLDVWSMKIEIKYLKPDATEAPDIYAAMTTDTNISHNLFHYLYQSHRILLIIFYSSLIIKCHVYVYLYK